MANDPEAIRYDEWNEERDRAYKESEGKGFTPDIREYDSNSALLRYLVELVYSFGGGEESHLINEPTTLQQRYLDQQRREWRAGRQRKLLSKVAPDWTDYVLE